MQLEERVVGDVTVLALSGRMTKDAEYGALQQKLRTLVHEGRCKLVLNLAAVSYMDSTCVGGDRQWPDNRPEQRRHAPFVQPHTAHRAPDDHRWADVSVPNLRLRAGRGAQPGSSS